MMESSRARGTQIEAGPRRHATFKPKIILYKRYRKTPIILSSWMEKFRGRKFRLPSTGRVKGIIIQQRSRITKMMMRRKATPKKLRRGVVLPPMVWLVIHGATIKKTKVIRARHTFWAVRFCTNYSVRAKRDR